MILSTIAQYILNRSLNALSGSYWDRLRLAFLNIFRRILIRIGDPLVHADIFGCPMVMPLSHDLPAILRMFPMFASNLARIARGVEEKYPAMSCIDIGGNIGDSIAVLRNTTRAPILCIEGEEGYFTILEKNARQFANVYLEKAFVGGRHETIQASIEKQRGTAAIHTGGSRGRTVQFKRMEQILSERPEFARSKLVKIDTDGFDCTIIRASTEVLRSMRPVLFFEYYPFLLFKQQDDGISVFATLGSAGYRNALLYDRTGEYMFSSALSDTRFIDEMHVYFSDPKGLRHCDLCVFHDEDTDLFEKLRVDELEAFREFHRFSQVAS